MSLPELPPHDIRVDAFGDVIPRNGRGFVMGDFYTAAQMHAYAESAIASLKSQLVEAQKDALRYQWAVAHAILVVKGWTYAPVGRAEWDNAIDRERKSEAAEQPSEE